MKRGLLTLVVLVAALLVLGSVASASQSVQTCPRYFLTTYLGYPTNLTGTPNGNQVKLKWSSVTSADGYVIFEQLSADSFIKLGDTTGTSFTAKNVSKGTHIYLVASYWFTPDSWLSAQSAIVAVKVTGKTTLGAPKSVKLQVKSSTKVKLTWKAGTNATSYIIYRSTSPGSGFKKVKSTKKLYYTDKVPKTNTTYYYKVVSKKGSKTKSAKARSIYVSTSSSVTYRALIIANNYPSSSAGLTQLDGVLVDGQGLKKMLDNLDSTPYTITYRSNRTRAQTFQDIDYVFSQADDDDVTLLYFGGHGCKISSSQMAQYTGALFATDSYYCDEMISAAQLRHTLDQYNGKKVILLNTCYSGYFIDKGMMAKEKSALTQNQLDAVAQSFISAFADAPRGTNLVGNNYYVMTACTSSEECFSNPTIGSFFLYCMNYGCGWDQQRKQRLGSLYADKNKNNQLTLNEVFTYTKNKIDTEYGSILSWDDGKYHHQTTCVYPTGSSLVLFGR